jgi:hypothetical protein
MDALEQRVAAEIADMDGIQHEDDEVIEWFFGDDLEQWKRLAIARAIIPLVLEHAAKVAERPIRFDYVMMPVNNAALEPGSPYDRGRKRQADDIAAAIRAIGAP